MPAALERLAASIRQRSGTAEQQRLDEAVAGKTPWQRWGTYVSERAWGTVREDYSADGDAWSYFPFEDSHRRAYRWNEDALAGWCDEQQTICMGLGLWNGADEVLKERPYGLTNSQGNHGEDVKDYWFFTDNTPTHSYASMVYKYPQVAFPYRDLRDTNAARNSDQPEYELFDALESSWRENRYFDVTVEYAKAGPEDVICRTTITNRGPDPAPIHVAAQLWYRNTWSWEVDQRPPLIGLAKGGISTDHQAIGRRWFYARVVGRSGPTHGIEWMFCENTTNNEAVFGSESETPYTKDGINDAIVGGDHSAVNGDGGSKAAAVATATLDAGATMVLLTRFTDTELDDPFDDADTVLATRHQEADEFYTAWQPSTLTEDERLVQRQAIAGLLWCKQFYNYHVHRWLHGDPTQPPPPAERLKGRNSRWQHIVNENVLLMPDAWEYPWYAAWDMGFHAVTMALVDSAFAKRQITLMLSSLYQHPHGQIPAYEWNFSDTNPPVLAWAAWQIYLVDYRVTGVADSNFLATAFRALLISLTEWFNTKDPAGDDLFAGGFLGMDNIGVFNRDEPLPTGGRLAEVDGTAWVAQMALQLTEIAVELSHTHHGYRADISKLLLDFTIVANVLEKGIDGYSLWNDDDGFYGDVIVNADGSSTQLGVISLQSVIPLLACISVPVNQTSEGLDGHVDQVMAELRDHLLRHHPEFTGSVALSASQGDGSSVLYSVVDSTRLRRILSHLLAEQEMLSDFGIRSVSAAYRDTPYEFRVGDTTYSVPYWPAESHNRMFGGNSNWRGPIWFPINLMLVQSLLAYDSFFGDTLAVDFPTGSDNQVSLAEVAKGLTLRLTRIFLRDSDGNRAVFGDNDYFQQDPNWRDLVPFHEYFDGDNGRGLGASHQTGWTATVALLLQFGGELRLNDAARNRRPSQVPSPAGAAASAPTDAG
ncbi:MAG TPA: glucosidase [Actinomycetota bacterium]|nr:glucosidase [Actinomycetota bacterium]